MSERRRGLGRGLGALIPTAPGSLSGPTESGPADRTARPSDVFFAERDEGPARRAAATGATGATGARDRDDQAGGSHARRSPSEGGRIETYGEDGLDTRLQPVPGARFAEIPLDLITPNPRQPRTSFDQDALAELVASIKEIGVLQPIVVRPISGSAPVRYELVMGERRWRASTEAGLATVPAIVKDTADDDLLRDALLENLHRSDLNPLDEAAAYQQLLDDFGCTHDELAARIGRSRPQITNTIRLLRLPPLVARRVAAGVLSAGHARALLRLEDPAAMERLAQRIVAEGLSVRSVEEIVAVGEVQTATARRARTPIAQDDRLADVAARLSDRFDTRVQVAMGRRKGKLTVEFASMEDLERIMALLGANEAR